MGEIFDKLSSGSLQRSLKCVLPTTMFQVSEMTAYPMRNLGAIAM